MKSIEFPFEFTIYKTNQKEFMLDYEKKPHFLIKKGKRLGLSIKRWFLIQQGIIVFFANETDATIGKKCKGRLNIEDINFKQVKSDIKDYHYCVEVIRKNGTSLYFYQKSALENNFFLCFLQKSMQNSNREYERFASILNGSEEQYTLDVTNWKNSSNNNTNQGQNLNNIAYPDKSCNKFDIDNNNDGCIIDTINKKKTYIANTPIFNDENVDLSDVDDNQICNINAVPITINNKSSFEVRARYPKIHKISLDSRLGSQVLNEFDLLNKISYQHKNSEIHKRYRSVAAKFYDSKCGMQQESIIYFKCKQNKDIDNTIKKQISSLESHECEDSTSSRKIKDIKTSSKVSRNILYHSTLIPSIRYPMIGPRVSIQHIPILASDSNLEITDNSQINSKNTPEIIQNIKQIEHNIEININSHKIQEDNNDFNDDDKFTIEFEAESLTDLFKALKNNKKYERITAVSINSKEECLKKGLKYLWDYELQNAITCFNYFAKEDFLFELLIIEVYILDVALTGNKKILEDIANKLKNILNKIYQKAIKAKDDINKYLCQELTKAEALLLRGFINGILGNKFQAFKNLAESWRIYKRLEGLVKNIHTKQAIESENINRLDFGFGTFNLIFSLIPQNLLKILKFIGINPNKIEGLQQLESLRKSNSIRSMHAALMVCLHNIEFQLDPNQATLILKDCFEKYPRCPFFHWIGSIISWRLCQADKAYTMVRNALIYSGEVNERSTYLLYEIGWYHFLTLKWKSALIMFEKIVIRTLDKKFFKNQNVELINLLKQLAIKRINYNEICDISTFTDPDIQAIYGIPINTKMIELQEVHIIPHLTPLLVKIAAVNFQLGNNSRGMKWLLYASIVSKKYTLFKNNIEEDFGRIALKYAHRLSKYLLTYEIFYFLKHLPKLPDELIVNISSTVDEYLQKLEIDPSRLQDQKYVCGLNPDLLCDYFTGMLIITINNCLLGETLSVCSIIDSMEPILDLIREDYLYIQHHLIYWFARALYSEGKDAKAKEFLKKGIKMKKCEFNITNKMKKLLGSMQSLNPKL